ncbi:glycosyltransferase family 4 protein [Mycolicibacterium sphagni]|uniref:Glycosyltransferase n=1 Tax=Mycolicibacterium sphagni TaxID=1786 RepID=A0ABX2JRN6_9MYCO|nr:glycosyltransferase [Mycolicibacterium sphagni]NTY60115.1 glycosyltransferase [Mycolicibacterium sphagni]
MEPPSVEQQLISVLTRPEPTLGFTGERYAALERLLVDLFGGQQPERMGPLRRPDVVIPRPGATPVALEVKVFSSQSFKKNRSNRVADLLSSAVETRRAFRGEVTLGAVLLTADAPDNRSVGVIRGRDSAEMAERLLRADDGAGYDTVLFGSANPAHSHLRWRFFAAATSEEPPTDLTTDSTAEVLELLRSQGSTARTQPAPRPVYRNQRIMLVSDEWRSGRGGISTLNRELAAALATAGADVSVLVPKTSDEDIRAASEVNVAIVTPARVPGLSDFETLLLPPVFADREWVPDIIIGHGRVLGPYAAAQQQFFPRARRVHLVHTDSEQLEAAKEQPGGDSHMRIADDRRNLERELARSADLVVGIGPLLTATISDALIGSAPVPKVIDVVPGLRSAFDAAAAQPPVHNRVLIVGRADDFQSKGIDIAANAMLQVVDGWPPSRPHRPALIIRGVPDEAAKQVKAQLDDILENQVGCYLRPYCDEEAEVVRDFAQARMLLMPSRHEGFGLSAYEAIASGIPVLISAESGLAEFLRGLRIRSAEPSILTTRNTSTRLAIDVWATAIQRVLDDPESARAQARELRRELRDNVSWEQAAEKLLAELK